MRNKLLLLLLLLLPAWVAWAQAPVWQNVSGITGTATTVRGSALAANGDYYIVGSYTGSADFGNGKSLTSSDQNTTDGFLARINGTTNLCTWVVSMGGTTGGDEVRGVAVSGSTVYITGYYNGSASFSNTSNAASQPLTAVNSSVDVFVAKYDENGNPLSSISGGGTSSDQGFSIAVNGTTIYVTGFISTNTTTSTNVKFGTVTLGNSGSQDMFVARFTDNGALAHGGALSGGGTALDRGNAIGVGPNGIYVAGYFTGTGTTTISGTALTGAGSNDIYVAKFTDSGSGLNNGGAVRSGGANSDQATALTVSGTSIYVGGFFNQNATAAGSVSISGSTLSSDNRDLFLAKYTDSGSGSGLSSGYAIRDGSANPESVGDLALSGSTVYVVGGYTTAASIAGSSLTSNGDDAYVAKYTDTGATFTAIGAIDGGPSAGGAATTGASTVSVSGNQVVLGGFLGSPATFAPAVTGSITVPANNTGFFARLAQAPVLTSISPNTGPVGASVTLTGTNLTGATVVTFSGTSNNTVTSVTVNGTGTQTITVNVPTGATTGNVTVTTPAGTSNGVVFTVQQPTTVASIVPTGANPTNATSVTFTVTFAANVTGVTTTNFATVNGGSVTGSSVVSVSGSGTTYSVVVNTGSGSGTVGLNMINDTGVTPSISNDPFTGQTVTIDKTAPTTTITSTAGASGGTTTTSPIPFTITFSESVTGFVQGDLTVAGGTIASFSGSGSVYTVNVTPSGSGSTVTVNVAANVAQDAAGNGNTAASQYGLTYQQPTVTVVSVTRLTPSPTATAQVSYRVVFSGNVASLTTGNFAATVSSGISGASVTSVSGSGTTYTVVVNTGTGDGTLRLDVANSTNTSPTIANVPYTAGEQYTITKGFVAAPTLRIQAAGSASGNGDVTAFVDLVQVLQSGTSTQVAGALQNSSFETNNVQAGSYLYQSQGVAASPWSFGGTQSGISRNNSGFESTAADGDAVAFLQSRDGNNGNVSQNLAVPTGSYQVRFRAMQRNYTSLDQRLNVFVNDVFVGTIQPNNIPTYDAFISAPFSVTAPALTATVSTSSASPTSTSPIPFSVSFSQSVGTSFTASDVTVLGGTLTSGSFSGSGAGPYTFTVTPTGAGTVTVSLAANVATDANNTGNLASNSVSVQYQLPQTAAPVVTAPANGSITNSATPTYVGTAPANSTVTVYVGLNAGTATAVGTTTAAASGNFALAQPTNLTDGVYKVYATAQSTGSTVSVSSNTNVFTIDTQRPSVVISSTAGASGSTTNTTPLPFKVTFSESVTGFVAGDVTVTNGTLSGFTAVNGATYTFNVTPATAGTATTVNVAANVASDAAGNGNTAASQYSLTYQIPAVTVTSVTRLTPSPTATAQVSYRVVFSGSVANLGLSNFDLTTSGLSGTGIASLSGSGTTYTVVVNTGTGDGTLRLNVANSTNTSPTIANVPYTAGEQYTITKGFVAAPTLRIQAAGSASGNGDVTAFVDVVQVLSNGTAVANALQNGSFETNNVDPSGFKKTADGVVASPWSFTGLAGVTRNGSAFGSTAYSGDAVALVQSGGDNNASLTQNLAVPTGSYQVNFQTMQRNYTSLDQRLNVFVNDVFVGTIQPNNIPTYDAFISAPFSVTAPALTATVSTSSASPTSTSPIPFSVSFSQSVGTSFTASDVTVLGGTLTSGSFSGSGAGPYAFTVTPTGGGTVTVSLAANVATDANNTGNAASNSVSVQYQPTITLAPASSTLPSGTQGTAYSVTLSASGGTAPYRFAITAGALPAGLSLNLSTGTISGTPTTNGSFNFTVTATDNSAAPGPYSGSQSYTLTIAAPAVTSVTWTGTISTDWFTSGNWSPNQVPNATLDATIPTAPSGGRFPFIGTNTANVRNLTFNSGATLNQAGGTLVIAANLTNNGTFQPTGGTVVLGNSNPSNILGSSNTRFWNLTIGASGAQQSTSASTSVQRLLTLNGGNFATNGNPFTLLSIASLTAQVTNNGGVVNGNVTVQRYIDPSLNPNLGYRHITTAVSGQTVSNLATGSFSPVVNPAYNASAQPGTTTPFPTVYGYDQSRLATATNNLSTFDKGWFSPNALSDALNVGQGYTALIGGGQTWAFTGPLNNGTQTLTLARNTGATAADAGLSLVGNPYPSPLDWRQVASNGLSNVDASLYVFQSNDPSNPYTGQYGVYTNGVGTVSPILAQGQGFFVRVTQGQTSGTLTFANSQRPTTYTATNYQRTAAETRPLVQLSLKAAGSATGDDAFVYFEQGSTEGFDAQYDARKLPNPSGLNLSTTVGSEQFSIDGRPAIGTVQRVIPLAVGVPAAGAYSLSSAQLLNLDTTPVYLRDLQTGALVDLAQQPTYQFTVSNASALITSRFELVFSPQKALATVPAALAQQVALYPNPAKTAAFVELPASLGRQAVTATLVDALGRQVRTVSLPAQGAVAHQLDLHELATGVYALRLSTSAGVVVKKLVVE